MSLHSPFPYFGGKSRVADMVWSRFGDVPNYVEPFFGSGAVLLARPHRPRIETVNDLDGFIANFWRALQADPEAVAYWADWPVNENDLHARHLWLMKQGREHIERLTTDPDYYDAKVAGWWVWGISQWIGSGWCSDAALRKDGTPKSEMPHLGDAGVGVHRKLPHLGNAGVGVHRKLPHLGDAGKGVHRKLDSIVAAYMVELSDRLRGVRVCCGDWSRVCGPSPTFKQGMTGVFLDPPYAGSEREEGLYAEDDGDVSARVREWCLENGDNLLLRIALCGYDGEHEMPATWEAIPWKAHGGYGSQGEGRGRENAEREMIWFSPACLKPTQTLFGWADGQAMEAMRG